MLHEYSEIVELKDSNSYSNSIELRFKYFQASLIDSDSKGMKVQSSLRMVPIELF